MLAFLLLRLSSFKYYNTKGVNLTAHPSGRKPMSAPGDKQSKDYRVDYPAELNRAFQRFFGTGYTMDNLTNQPNGLSRDELKNIVEVTVHSTGGGGKYLQWISSRLLQLIPELADPSVNLTFAQMFTHSGVHIRAGDVPETDVGALRLSSSEEEEEEEEGVATGPRREGDQPPPPQLFDWGDEEAVATGPRREGDQPPPPPPPPPAALAPVDESVAAAMEEVVEEVVEAEEAEEEEEEEEEEGTAYWYQLMDSKVRALQEETRGQKRRIEELDALQEEKKRRIEELEHTLSSVQSMLTKVAGSRAPPA